MPSYPPTEEQAAIIGGFGRGENMKVKAGAGAGKTSTLRMIAEDKPSHEGIYIAYNRAIADDARGSFPSNVLCATAHSLAFRTVGRKYQTRLNGPRLPAREVARRLGIVDDLDLGDKKLPPSHQARLVMEAVGRFCYSDEDEIRVWHVPAVNGIEPDAMFELKKTILPYTYRAWADIMDVDGELKFEHDHYLKIWGLSKPRLDADYVLLDEAQDANPIIADIFNRQTHMQRILVGDANQAIYGWRGAVDAMENFEGTTYTLTKSFRFGEAVALEANKWLTYLDADIRIQGYEKITSRVGEVPSPRAILCRTNAGAVGEALSAQAGGRLVALVGGGDAIRRLALAAADLKGGRRTDHPELFMFDSWQEVEDDDDDDGVSVQKYRSFEEFGMLTRDEGIVVDMTDGSRFAVTIKEMTR